MEVAAAEADVEAWWRRWPDANVGVVTGRVSGIVVLDVDPRSGGGHGAGCVCRSVQYAAGHGRGPNRREWTPPVVLLR